GAYESQFIVVPSYVVNTTADFTGVTDPNFTTLREAIAGANLFQSTDNITFDPTVFVTPRTITLSGGNGLELTDTVGETRIFGPAAGVPISIGRDAHGLSQSIFNVHEGVTAAFVGLTISGAHTVGRDDFSGYGAGIHNDGNLTLTNCTISGNHADAAGGGLFNTGVATLTNCTISKNYALYDGGGVMNRGTLTQSTLTLTNCTVSGNISHLRGGGVFNH